MAQHTTTFGAFPTPAGVKFSVWAPEAKHVELVLFQKDGKSEAKRLPLQKDERGIFIGDTIKAFRLLIYLIVITLLSCYTSLTPLIINGSRFAPTPAQLTSLHQYSSTSALIQTYQEVSTGSLYKYTIDGKGPFPDPASRFQPDGVHGCSQVIDHSSFKWSDNEWKGLAKLEQAIVYELHVGTFTKEGTFKAITSKLEYLKNELGVTMIELLPLADWPGRWNWGYDGVALYAPSRAYGTPEDLKELVNSAHQHGLAIIIDLVYNHLGPDGNYLSCYNPHYFTNKHSTPWGAALNYDLTSTADKDSKESLTEQKTDTKHAPFVRSFIVENAVSWMHDYHFDGARLDATHAIVDYSSPHVLQELVAKSRAAVGGRKLYFFAEDDRNEIELVTKENGLDSLWADDFHHQVRVAFAGDNESYFANFTGSTKDLADTIRAGWFFCGQAVPDTGKPRGTDPTDVVSKLVHFCYCIQNHDQIGNRAMGERLNHQIAPHLYKTASALLLLAPETPMLFQGQEWASSSPFQFFTDHNAELGRLVTEGRRKEFSKFKAFNDPATREKIPDPQAESTFQNSKLKWDEVHTANHGPILKLYQALLKLRLSDPAMASSERDLTRVEPVDTETLLIARRDLVFLFNLKDRVVIHDLTKFLPIGYKSVEVVLTTEDAAFITANDKAQPPTLDKHQVHFSRSSAVVLRIKA